MSLSRWAAALAVVLFTLSPLAGVAHRFLLLDNLGMPLLLGALLAGCRLRQSTGGAAVAGALLGAAVLVKETNLLMVPVLALLLAGRDETRQPSTGGPTWRRLAAAGAGLVAVAGAWPLYALLRGELVAGRGEPSLLDGLHFQLIGRRGGGSVLDPSSERRQLLAHWLRLDPWLLGLGAAAGGAAAAVKRLRPVVLALAILAAGLVRPGYLPAMYVTLALPFAALSVAGAAEWCWRRAAPRLRYGRPAAGAAALALAVAVLPGWLRSGVELPTWQGERAYGRAVAWLADNVRPGEVILVDDGIWLDVVEAGFPAPSVVLSRELDGQRPAWQGTPADWRQVAYVVETPSLRRAARGPGGGELAGTRRALAESTVVARVRSGGIAIDVRRLADEAG
ncbi:MAG: glycosyltransferase family 39 protein [Acidimicrobiales bacterium]